MKSYLSKIVLEVSSYENVRSIGELVQVEENLIRVFIRCIFGVVSE